MALGLTFSNGKPAPMGRGKYQTRNNRLVEITGSRIVSGTTAGTPWTKTVWDGDLYQSDLKAVETRATWSNDGGYLHEEGVGNSLDLMTVITQEAEPAAVATAVEVPANDPAVLHNQLLSAALVNVLSEDAGPGEQPLDTLKRIIAERNRAESEPTEVAEKAHAFDELAPVFAKEAGAEYAGEPPSVTLGRIISERDTAQRQVKALLETPVA